MSRIYFVIGVNGVGKSTVIPLLESRLDSGKYEIHDFDERGVPDNADGSWRLSETLHWATVGKGNLEKGISTIVCGFVKAKEIKQATEVSGADIAVCLLDADGQTIEGRILSRYLTPESLVELERTTGKTPLKFAQDNIWVSTKFREDAVSEKYFILDTSTLNPEQVASAVVSWLAQHSNQSATS